MFRLLAILVALHFSSRIDGAPNGVIESGRKIDSSNKDQSHFILGEGTVERKNGVTLEEKDTVTSGTEPTLKPRKLDDFTSGWNKPSAKSRGKKRARDEPVEDVAKTIDTVDNNDQNQTTSTWQTSSPPRPQGMSKVDIINEGIRFRRESAMHQVEDVKDRLAVPGADPLKDEKLASRIDSAFFSYHNAFNLREPRFRGSDEENELKLKLEALKPAFDSIDYRREGRRSTRFSSVNPRPVPSIPDKRSPSPSKPTPNYKEEFEMFLALENPKEAAEKTVREARAILKADPDADLLKDEKLAKLITLAVEQYNRAHDRPQLRLQGLGEQARIRKTKAELYQIFDDYDRRNESLKDIMDSLDVVKRLRQSST